MCIVGHGLFEEIVLVFFIFEVLNSVNIVLCLLVPLCYDYVMKI